MVAPEGETLTLSYDDLSPRAQEYATTLFKDKGGKNRSQEETIYFERT